MEPSNQERPQEPKPTREPYAPPRLARWGTITELTLGGGGRRQEPSKRKTRF